MQIRFQEIKKTAIRPEFCFCLTLLRPMGFSIKFDTVKSRWSIGYIEGLQVIISKKNISLKMDFVLVNSA